jgi:DNA-binding FrmR family transcriptional regulator
MPKRKIDLSEESRRSLIVSVKKILGQLEAIKTVLENNQVEDQTFNQLLAVKGGATKICKEIIAKGVMPNLHKYSQEEIDNALEIIFRLG